MWQWYFLAAENWEGKNWRILRNMVIQLIFEIFSHCGSSHSTVCMDGILPLNQQGRMSYPFNSNLWLFGICQRHLVDAKPWSSSVSPESIRPQRMGVKTLIFYRVWALKLGKLFPWPWVQWWAQKEAFDAWCGSRFIQLALLLWALSIHLKEW